MSAGPPVSRGSLQSSARAVNCPNCGAALTIRSTEHAVSLVCENCHSILDAKDPNLQILQTFEASTTEAQPLIPLGSRGKWRGTVWEVIGFQRRSITVQGADYDWHEYLLFNPFKGFRYLTEYQGHWNDVSVLNAIPQQGIGENACYLGKTYRHFQTATATTRFVLGEFPWQVRVGENADITDYVNPPYVLSCERTEQEITWSLGEYVSGQDLWKALGLSGNAPAPIGVYENQPSNLRREAASIWATFALLASLLALMFVMNELISQDKQVFEDSYLFRPSSVAEASFVTPTFELTGRVSNVQIETHSNVNNEWIYLNYALINEKTGQAYDFGREVSYYAGRDSDGTWTEGSHNDNVIVPMVPSGTYYLRVEPESDRSFPPIGYTITVTRDVPVPLFYLLALLALLTPALLISWKIFNFEHLRWAESDHAG